MNYIVKMRGSRKSFQQNTTIDSFENINKNYNSGFKEKKEIIKELSHNILHKVYGNEKNGSKTVKTRNEYFRIG